MQYHYYILLADMRQKGPEVEEGEEETCIGNGMGKSLNK